MSGVAAATIISAGAGVYGSSQQASSSKKAMNVEKGAMTRGTQMQLAADREARQNMLPFTQMGLSSIPLLEYSATGMMPTSNALTPEEQQILGSLQAGKAALEKRRAALLSSTTGSRKNQRRFAAEVNEIDAKLGQLAELDQRNTMAQAISTAQQQVGEFGQPTQNERNYIDSLSEINPRFDVDYENDPLMNQQKEVMLRELNRRMAGQGKYASSDADNALIRNMLPLMQDAYGRAEAEYGREYDKNVDLYNLENALSNRQYGRQLDLAKTSLGAVESAGNQLVNTAGNVASQRQQSAQRIGGLMQQRGESNANLWSNLGAAPLQGMTAYGNIKANNALTDYYNRQR